jgi:fatty acid desaturase
MDITNEEAAQSLAAVEQTTRRTRRSISAYASADLLTLWGGIWILAYLGTHLRPHLAGWIWPALVVPGVILTVVMSRRALATGQVLRISAEKRRLLRYFWAALAVYGGLWIAIARPTDGIQLNALLCTVVMFAYVVLGLMLQSRLQIALGLAVTAVTLAGYFIVPRPWYCLWMAVAAGGTLFGAGLFVRMRWR